MVLLALSYFQYFFCCRLMNIFLAQFWTVKLLIHKLQPRHTSDVNKNTKVFCLGLFVAEKLKWQIVKTCHETKYNWKNVILHCNKTTPYKAKTSHHMGWLFIWGSSLSNVSSSLKSCQIKKSISKFFWGLYLSFSYHMDTIDKIDTKKLAQHSFSP